MSTEKTMTAREAYTAIINGEITDEVIAWAEKSIVQLDHKNELRKAKPSKESVEVANRRSAVAELMADGNVRSIPQVAELLGITKGQAQSALGSLVKDGTLSKSTAKVDKAIVTLYEVVKGE